MSIWNLPLAVDLPEVRTPTPAPLATIGQPRARRSQRYGLTLTEPGCELVLRCSTCGESSTSSLSGAAGWHVLRRDSSCAVAFCVECSGQLKAAQEGGSRKAS
jgi:hypothetical protein